MDQPQNKVIFSGIQPSGVLHLGNYLGAIKQWVALQEQNTCYFCVVDEHAITVPYEPKDLPERVLQTAAVYLAAGIDPDKSVVFVQSHVPEHTELGWLLMTLTPFGDLQRMTQFKDKAAKQKAAASAGLFGYPDLMAADILLYHTDLVPVGEDQVQHVELTRSLAQRFNNRFGETFIMPEPFLNQSAARIMSLQEPKKKMSKSDPDKTYIALTDEPDVIHRKIMGAVTETKPVISFSESGPAVLNLLNIYRALSDETPETIEANFSGKGYKELKEELAELIVAKLAPLQKRHQELRANDDDLRIMLGRGQHRAKNIASQTLQDVKRKMGLI